MKIIENKSAKSQRLDLKRTEDWPKNLSAWYYSKSWVKNIQARYGTEKHAIRKGRRKEKQRFPSFMRVLRAWLRSFQYRLRCCICTPSSPVHRFWHRLDLLALPFSLPIVPKIFSNLPIKVTIMPDRKCPPSSVMLKWSGTVKHFRNPGYLADQVLWMTEWGFMTVMNGEGTDNRIIRKDHTYFRMMHRSDSLVGVYEGWMVLQWRQVKRLYFLTSILDMPASVVTTPWWKWL